MLRKQLEIVFDTCDAIPAPKNNLKMKRKIKYFTNGRIIGDEF